MTRYIFPGGELDHIGLSLDHLEIHEFDIHDVEGLREHYAKTCRIWAERLYARRHEAEAMIGEVRDAFMAALFGSMRHRFRTWRVCHFPDCGFQARTRRLWLAADWADLYL